MLTPAEVAQWLKITERKVGELLRKKELIGVKVGKEWRIDPNDLDEFIERSKRK